MAKAGGARGQRAAAVRQGGPSVPVRPPHLQPIRNASTQLPRTEGAAPGEDATEPVSLRERVRLLFVHQNSVYNTKVCSRSVNLALLNTWSAKTTRKRTNFLDDFRLLLLVTSMHCWRYTGGVGSHSRGRSTNLTQAARHCRSTLLEDRVAVTQQGTSPGQEGKVRWYDRAPEGPNETPTARSPLRRRTFPVMTLFAAHVSGMYRTLQCSRTGFLLFSRAINFQD